MSIPPKKLSSLQSSPFPISLSILLTLLLHAILFFWFQQIYLPNHGLPSTEKLILRKFKLERTTIDSKWVDPQLPDPKKPLPDLPKTHSSFTPAAEKRTLARLLSEKTSSPTLPSGTPSLLTDKPVPSVGENRKPDSNTRALLEKELQSTREQLLNQTTKPASAGRPLLETPGAPVTPKTGSPEMAPPTQAAVGPSQGPVTEVKLSGWQGSSQLESFFGSPGGILPLEVKSTPHDATETVPQSLTDRPKTTRKFESLNPFLNVELFTREKTFPDEKKKGGYFLIRISAKPDRQLEVIPKDVWFVLDVSSSIGKARLKVFREMVLQAIPLLNKEDRFRILAFRGGLVHYSQEWISADTPPTEKIKGWLDHLNTGGVTDVFEGLQPLGNQRREKGRMTMAFLMSDGMPTKGILDSTQIISEFSEENDHTTSIFSISSGTQVNNFLLDFLSYSNQGWLRYSEQIPGSEESFQELSRQVQDPLFRDLRFKFTGVEDELVCPQNLPNLYRGCPLLLFGRYEPGKTQTISLQILGESVDKTRELLVRLPIPEKPNGPENLPETWARQRIYHILGRVTRTRGNPQRAWEEVETISEKYGVEIPYFK